MTLDRLSSRSSDSFVAWLNWSKHIPSHLRTPFLRDRMLKVAAPLVLDWRSNILGLGSSIFIFTNLKALFVQFYPCGFYDVITVIIML